VSSRPEARRADHLRPLLAARRQGCRRRPSAGTGGPGAAAAAGAAVGLPALRAQVRRNLAAQDELAEEFGLLAAVDVARLAGSTAADPERLVRDWRQQGRVFDVPTADGPRLSGFQFDERRVPRPAIAGVLAAFADRLPAWGLALWFTGGNAWLGNRRPVDALNIDEDLVVQAATRVAEELP
jgi:hypothetical protein